MNKVRYNTAEMFDFMRTLTDEKEYELIKYSWLSILPDKVDNVYRWIRIALTAFIAVTSYFHMESDPGIISIFIASLGALLTDTLLVVAKIMYKAFKFSQSKYFNEDLMKKLILKMKEYEYRTH